MDEEPEKRLQQFFATHVFFSGYQQQRVGEIFSAVETLVDSIVKWAYQSSTGLYPQPPMSVGSYREGLHLQPEDCSTNFDFLVPVRFNPKLAIISGGLTKQPSHYEQKLPTYIFHDSGVPVYLWGTKILVDLEAVEEAHVEVHCHNQKAWLEDDDIDLDELNEYKVGFPNVIGNFCMNVLGASQDDRYGDSGHPYRCKNMSGRCPAIIGAVR